MLMNNIRFNKPIKKNKNYQCLIKLIQIVHIIIKIQIILNKIYN